MVGMSEGAVTGSQLRGPWSPLSFMWERISSRKSRRYGRRSPLVKACATWSSLLSARGAETQGSMREHACLVA